MNNIAESQISPPTTTSNISTPFHIRHSRNQLWENWGKSFQCQPEYSFYPNHIDDLIEIVHFARVHGLKIRVAASGHSWSDIATTDSVMVNIHQLNQVSMDLSDTDNPRVVIESGATVKEVNDVLETHGYALPFNVVLESVRFGGLIATGSHGSGWNHATLSDLVHSIELVTSSGEIRKFVKGVDSDEVMNAVRLNLGMFGIMVRISMNVQKSWVVHAKDERLPIQDVLDKLQERVLSHDNLDLFWWPFSDEFWVKTWKRIPETRTTARPRYSFIDSAVATIGSRIHNGLITLTQKFPSLTPPLSRFTLKLTPSKGDKIVNIVEAVHYRRAIEFARMGCVEVAFKIDSNFENVKWAMQQVFDLVKTYEQNGLYPLNVVMNVRFINHSDCLLSPAFGEGHTCYIEILGRTNQADWHRFSGDVARLWLTLPQARPHWAKEFQHIPDVIESIKSSYGENITRFNQIKAELQVDPEGMFMNPSLEKIFKPQTIQS